MIIGLQRRYDDGQKRAVTGSRRGLCYELAPDDHEPVGNTVLVVEGHSDTAAGLSVDLWTIGRPNNLGGSEMIAKLLRHPVQALGCRIVVLGENDRKEDGRWPGREGAEKVSRALATAWGTEVYIGFPPDEDKDLRSWVRRLLPKPKSTTRAQRRTVGEAILSDLESRLETVFPPGGPPTLPPPEIPEPLKFSAKVEEIIVAGVGTMPCPAHAVPLLQKKGSPTTFQAIMARCRRWTCDICKHARRSAWLIHLAKVFRDQGLLHAAVINCLDWDRIRQSISHAKLSHVKIDQNKGTSLVIASGNLRDGHPVTVYEACDMVAEAIVNLDAEGKRPVNTSRDWALHLDRSQESSWTRRGQGPRDGFAIVTHRVRRQGCEPEIGGRGDIHRASWNFPADWDAERIDEALKYLQGPPHPTEIPDPMDDWRDPQIEDMEDL